jgi:uncharacterized membrane protein YtjA (UPF0391 family)
MSLLNWGIVALIISLFAGAVGFSGSAKSAATIAKIIFGFFLLLALSLFVLIVLGVSSG